MKHKQAFTKYELIGKGNHIFRSENWVKNLFPNFKKRLKGLFYIGPSIREFFCRVNESVFIFFFLNFYFPFWRKLQTWTFMIKFTFAMFLSKNVLPPFFPWLASVIQCKNVLLLPQGWFRVEKRFAVVAKYSTLIFRTSN